MLLSVTLTPELNIPLKSLNSIALNLTYESFKQEVYKLVQAIKADTEKNIIDELQQSTSVFTILYYMSVNDNKNRTVYDIQ